MLRGEKPLNVLFGKTFFCKKRILQIELFIQNILLHHIL